MVEDLALAPSPERMRQLADALARSTAELSAAAVAAGRNPADVQIVAVTKRFPASDVIGLARLGVSAVGENRHQEAAAKHDVVQAELARLAIAPPQWHFIGQLQTNKAKAVARYADWVDTVDRPALVAALSAGATSAGRDVAVLVQVNLADDFAADSHRGGARPQDVVALADAVVAAPGLHLRGIMGMAPLGGDPGRAFSRLADVAALVRAKYPEAKEISAGMSGDAPIAVAAGATQVRLGTSLLGDRPPLG